MLLISVEEFRDWSYDILMKDLSGKGGNGGRYYGEKRVSNK